jgi:hypothetical protein
MASLYCRKFAPPARGHGRGAALDDFLQSPTAAFDAGYISPREFGQHWYKATRKKAAYTLA